MDKREILKVCKEENVQFIRFWFSDILGILKGFAITFRELEDALENGMGFDGSSIEGFVRIDESDMVAMPDPSTFRVLPWQPENGIRVAGMFCDILTPDRRSYGSDPRFVLRRNLKRAEELGFRYYVGPELEFFYFRGDEEPIPLDHGGYFDLISMDEGSLLRKKTVMALEEFGIEVEYSHHEVAPSQHEIDLRYKEALEMADSAMLYRMVVKEVAYKNGVYATFMPKPLYGQNGNGMHVHMSLFEGDRNAFFSSTAEDHLSDVAKHFIAGLLRHAPEITLITNQWANSYKRLVPGYEAPIYLTWARRNRSDLIRVPQYAPGHERSTRLEYRCPDPACNPYLAFAVMLAAGLEGIEKGYSCPEPVEENVYLMSPEERRSRGIGQLPSNLYAAIEAAQSSELLRKALGEELLEKLLRNKLREWEEYRAQITPFEIERYLPIL